MNEKQKTPQTKICGGVQKLVGRPAQGHCWGRRNRPHYQAFEA